MINLSKLKYFQQNIFSKITSSYKRITRKNSDRMMSNFHDTTSGEPSDDYYLDDKSLFILKGFSTNDASLRWIKLEGFVDKRTALILHIGEEINLPDTLKIHKDTHLFIRYASPSPDLNTGTIKCEILYSQSLEQKPEKTIAILFLNGHEQSREWREVDLDISFLAGYRGHFIVRCISETNALLTSKCLAISDLCIAREDRLSLIRSRSFHELRSHNEIEHFSSVYRHSMYSEVQNKQAKVALSQSRPVRKLIDAPVLMDELKSSVVLSDVLPLTSESPYDYATRLLGNGIAQTAPDFAKRLKLRSESGRIVRVLSLCSGAARFEASFSSQVGNNVEWSLLDINVDLLGIASSQFPPSIKVDLIEANVNELNSTAEKWDVILCISALHHVVELERLFKFCHDSLNEDGEFWSIGENVGRNGNRLWPEARVGANIFFKQLPEKYRVLRHDKKVVDEIPDDDFSVGCFEGIRSEDIENTLDRWFQPVDVYRRNCFLWRLINLAFSDNFDLNNAVDRMWIIRMVDAELNHYIADGRGTELHGVYKPRMFNRKPNAVVGI